MQSSTNNLRTARDTAHNVVSLDSRGRSVHAVGLLWIKSDATLTMGSFWLSDRRMSVQTFAELWTNRIFLFSSITFLVRSFLLFSVIRCSAFDLDLMFYLGSHFH